MSGRRSRVFYGWWVVSTAALGLCLGGPLSSCFSFAVFLKSLSQEFPSGRAGSKNHPHVEPNEDRVPVLHIETEVGPNSEDQVPDLALMAFVTSASPCAGLFHESVRANDEK